MVNASLLEAARLIQCHEISSLELVDATLAHIERTEPSIHAYSLVLEKEARVQARELDREVARHHSRGLLHGIPIALKDVIDMAGLPTKAGSAALTNHTAREDATVVKTLRNAGAVFVGKTVTHEFAVGANIVPTVYPWRPGLYTGGSSAGSGVAVAMRMAFAAVGTDTGGSIRIPASLNGIVGLKPTFGLVSTFGVFPLSWSLDHVGPMARSVGDVAALLFALAGDRDPASLSLSGRPEATRTVGLAGVRLGLDPHWILNDLVQPETRAAVEAAVTDLKGLGAEVIEVLGPRLDYCRAAAGVINFVEAAVVHRRLISERGGSYDPATIRRINFGRLIPGTDYVEALQARDSAKMEMRALFATHQLDAVIGPTLPMASRSPVDINAALPELRNVTPMSTYSLYSRLANLTGQPALTVPCGFSTDDLPIGLQLLAAPFREDLLFRIGGEYEKVHSWNLRCPPLADSYLSHDSDIDPRSRVR